MRAAHFRLDVGGLERPAVAGRARSRASLPNLELTIVLNLMRMVLMPSSFTSALLVAEAEHDHAGGFLAEYVSILTDPAHVAVELTFLVIIDGILVGLLWPLIQRFVDAKLHKQHEEFDREHGIHHHGDHVHIDPEIMHPVDEHPNHA